MSAIYGIIDLNGDLASKESLNIFLDSYSACKIDRHEHKLIKNALMGCELQYYTNEAQNEILPIYDEENNILFTADCILDNRDTLMKDLCITDSSVADGTLMYKGFLKWGRDCVSHFRGMFSFAIYDFNTNEVIIAVDQFVNRCIFYHVRNNTVYFSTMLMPLVKASKLKFELNNRWLYDSISMVSPNMITEPIECAYADVFKLKAGHTVSIKLNKKPDVKSYYNPVKDIKINYKITEDEVRKELHETLSTSVRACLRTDGEVAVQLSAGLDSTSIASLAAPMLKQEGKNLYSFTSIPLKESTHRKDRYHLDDESEGVMNMVDAFPNIIPEFVECRGQNILNQGKELVDLWEMPCQSHQNAVWVTQIYKEATSKDCKVLLSGATGNCTISAGGVLDLFIYQLKHLHFRKAWSDFSYFCSLNKIQKKRFLNRTLKDYFKYLLVRYTPYTPEPYKYVLSRRDLGKKYNYVNRIIKKTAYSTPWISEKNAKSFIYLTNAYAQICEIDTNYSLYYKILHRDPMRNVEFINFLSKLPMEYFVNKQYERRLVREFMEGIVPEKIRLDIHRRGRQSADNMYRISLDWDEYKPQIQDALTSELSREYFDPNIVNEKLSKLTGNTLLDNELEARVCIDGYLFLYYVNTLKKYT